MVEAKVMTVFLEFYRHCKIDKSLNDTFIALIPKKRNVVNIKYFHPISLVKIVYKLLAKVLTNRLKMVLDNLISKL